MFKNAHDQVFKEAFKQKPWPVLFTSLPQLSAMLLQ